MGKTEPSPLKVWFWVVVFFATGVVIAMAVALVVIDKRAPLPVALIAGAAYGGCGAFVLFFLGLRLRRWISRRFRGR